MFINFEKWQKELGGKYKQLQYKQVYVIQEGEQGFLCLPVTTTVISRTWTKNI